MQRKNLVILVFICGIISLTGIYQVSASIPLEPDDIGYATIPTSAYYKDTVFIQFHAYVKCTVKISINDVIVYNNASVYGGKTVSYSFTMIAPSYSIRVQAWPKYPFSGYFTCTGTVTMTLPNIYGNNPNYGIGDPISDPNMQSLGSDKIRTKEDPVRDCMDRIIYFGGIDLGEPKTQDYKNGNPTAQQWLDAIWAYFKNPQQAPHYQPLPGSGWSWSTDKSMATAFLSKNSFPESAYNCIDYAGLLTSLGRIVGIPTRLITTSFFSSDPPDVYDYHVLAEFWVGNTWKVISILTNDEDDGRANWGSATEMIEVRRLHYTWGYTGIHGQVDLKINVFWNIQTITQYGSYKSDGFYNYPENYRVFWDYYDNTNYWFWNSVDPTKKVKLDVGGDTVTQKSPVTEVGDLNP